MPRLTISDICVSLRRNAAEASAISSTKSSTLRRKSDGKGLYLRSVQADLLKLKAFMDVSLHQLYPVNDGMVEWQNLLSRTLNRPVAPISLTHEVSKALSADKEDCGPNAKVLVMDEVSHGGPVECLWDLGDSVAPQMAFDIFKTLAHEMEGQLFRAVEIMGDDDLYE